MGPAFVLPLKEVVAGCLTHCAPKWSTDCGCSRAAERGRPDEAGEPAGVRGPGASRHGQRPQQACGRTQGRRQENT